MSVIYRIREAKTATGEISSLMFLFGDVKRSLKKLTFDFLTFLLNDTFQSGNGTEVLNSDN